MIILLQVHNTLNFGHGCLRPMMKLRYIESKVLDVCATLSSVYTASVESKASHVYFKLSTFKPFE